MVKKVVGGCLLAVLAVSAALCLGLLVLEWAARLVVLY